MRNLIKRVLNAFKRTLRAMTGVVVYSLNLATGVLTAAFRRAEYDEQPEENAATVVDAEARDLVKESVDQPVARPAAESTLAQRVKNCVLAVDAGRPIDAEFDLIQAEHRAGRDWFLTLDSGHIRALRHMPMPALGAHLNARYSVKAHGLPRYPVASNANAPTNAGAPEEMDFQAAAQARP